MSDAAAAAPRLLDWLAKNDAIDGAIVRMFASVSRYPDSAYSFQMFTLVRMMTVALAQRTRAPVVPLNTSQPRPGLITVGSDAATGARVATRHLIDHGHTRIALIMGRPNRADLEAREAGWLAEIEDAGLSPGPVGRGDFGREGGFDAALQIFSRAERPSAVFVSSDLQAIGALSALHSLGLRVPDDVAVISYDGTAEAQFAIPALTTVHQPVPEMASRAVELLLSSPPPEAQHVMFAPELILRDSCGRH